MIRDLDLHRPALLKVLGTTYFRIIWGHVQYLGSYILSSTFSISISIDKPHKSVLE